VARKTTPSFIVELPLSVSQADDAEAMVRLDLARRLFNACLGEALKRLDLMRESKAWQKARLLNRTSQKKERNEEFKRLSHQFGFNLASISAFGTQCKNEAKWKDHLGAHETQRISERAFHAAEEYSFGKRGRPRFKGRNRPLHSLEGKSDGSGLKWNKEIGCLQWSGMVLPAMLPPDHKDQYLTEALHARTKYARVVWRNVKGQRRWFAQLIQEGNAPRKYETIEGAIVGLDVGPSTVAVYSENGAALLPLCPEVDQPWKKMKKLQRAMDRSRRATNPDCFNADGTHKRGAKIKNRSKRYQQTRHQLAETERILENTRDRSHGNLINRILALGNVVQTEKLSYVAFQKNFGRSTKVRAVGALMASLQRKAESAGGEVIELNTWHLKMSQYDHTTNTYTKKPLSQRWHMLGDGSGVVQRDMYSAFLAANAAGNAIHPHQVSIAWSTAQSLLARAGWMQPQSVSVASLLATAPTLKAPERIARERALATGNTQDDVVARREPVNAGGSALRTPCL
jgi:hypothetical protein